MALASFCNGSDVAMCEDSCDGSWNGSCNGSNERICDVSCYSLAAKVFRLVGCRNLRGFMQWPIGGFLHESGIRVCEGSWDSSCGDFWDGSEVAICDSYCDGSCKVVVTDQ